LPAKGQFHQKFPSRIEIWNLAGKTIASVKYRGSRKIWQVAGNNDYYAKHDNWQVLWELAGKSIDKASGKL